MIYKRTVFPKVILRQFIHKDLTGNRVKVELVRLSPDNVAIMNVDQTIDANEPTIFAGVDKILQEIKSYAFV